MGRLLPARGSALAAAALTIITGCNGETQAPGNVTPGEGLISPAAGSLTQAWSVPLPSQGAGVAVHPVSGLLYVTVAQGGEGAFRRGGGIVTISSSGVPGTEIALQMKPCADSVCPVFMPNAPVISPDGSALYVGDNSWNAYFFATHLGFFFDVRPHGRILPGDRIDGISGASEIDIANSRVLIPGSALYSLDMSDGEVRVAREVDSPIRQVTRAGARRYILNQTAPQATQGRLSVWNPLSDRLRKFDLPAPVHWVSSQKGWTVALSSDGDECVISELKFMENSSEPRISLEKIGSFRPLGRSGCPGYRMALAGESRVVVLGGEGQAFAVRAATGRSYFMAVERVRGIAVSPDESAVHVVEPTRVKTFVLSP